MKEHHPVILTSCPVQFRLTKILSLWCSGMWLLEKKDPQTFKRIIS